MAEMNFGGVMETVVTSHEFSLEKAREVLKNETIAVIGYGIHTPTFTILEISHLLLALPVLLSA